MKKSPRLRSQTCLAVALCVGGSLLFSSLASAQHAVDLGMSKFGVRHVRISFTAAQLNGMYAAPVKLLDPQGAGKSIVLTKAIFTMTRTATAFANGGAAIIQYGSTVNGGGTQSLDSTIAASVLTAAGAATTVTVRNGAVISSLPAASIQNAPLYLWNQTAAFDTGTGTATLDLWYYVNQ